MTTRRDIIDDRLAAALAAVTSVTTIEIEPEGDPDAFPSLALYQHGDAPIGNEYPLIRFEGDYTLSGAVERGGGADAVAERNDLHAAAVRAIMADEQLGGAIELIEWGQLRKGRFELSSSGRLTFDQDFKVQFTTSRTDPALPA